jgi:hypothetical protein
MTWGAAWSAHDPVFTGLWHFPLAITLLIPLLRHRPPSAAGLVRWAPALPLLLVLTDHGLARALPDISGILQQGVVFAFFLGSLLWLAVDERLAMAVGLLLLNVPLVQLIFILAGDAPSLAVAAATVAITAFLPAVLLLTSGLAAKRRAVI